MSIRNGSNISIWPASLAQPQPLRRWGVALLLALLAVAGRPVRSEATMVFTPSGFIEEVVASGLPFATGIAFAPDGRLFITLKSGQVRVYQNGALLPTPFIDISASVADSNDRGLLGVAVHPDFPNTPYVYLLYTWNPPGFSNLAIGGRVSRLIRVEADPAQGYNVAKPGSDVPQTVAGGPGHVILLGTNSTAANIGNPTDGRDTTKASCMTGLTMAGAPIENCIPSDEDSHSIGTVMFGVDGSLFVGSGDGSNYSSVDPRALRSQNKNSLAGKVMRIDPATGLGLPDNPFFDATCPQCNRSKVYAYGLRNPFRFTLHPVTNEPYIGDVGWSTWEEIDTGKGANFGWPCYEGGATGSPVPVESGNTTSLQEGSYAGSSATLSACNTLYAQGLGAVRAPIFSYSHDGNDGTGMTGGASINGGTFYTGTVYPPAYQNALFILDYNRRWIRYLTFDAQGHATVHNFGLESDNGMVQVLTGPDSNLYVVVLSEIGSQIRRIRYVGAGNTPPTAVAAGTPAIGTVPLAVTFSSVGSFDPDSQPLSYGWTFGDGATSTQANPSHTYAAAGVYTATLTVTELTTPFASRSATVLITVGNEPPIAHITTPADGTTYKIGDTISYSGTGTAGGQPLDDSQLSWDIRLHHNQHQHFTRLPSGPSGSFLVIEHGDDTYYELCLTATVSETVTDTQCVNLLPQLTTLTLTTDPAGLFINYEDEGLTQASPMIIHSVVGSDQTASVPLIQGGLTFNGWADGEPSTSHPFIVGTTSATYTARYVNQPPVAVTSVGPVSGVVPLTVGFTGSGSFDPEFSTLTYSWDFGDGTTSTQADTTHTYTATGTYQAELTVTDQLDGVGSKTVTVTVTTPSANCGNGQLDAGEACDSGPCCTASCQFALASTVCRAAVGACDVAETCSGASAACPANGFVGNGTSCSDSNLCNGAETCQAGTCTTGTALVCNDGNPCTTDSCNPGTGCVFANNTAPCSDGVACTSDVCSNGACVSTPACTAGQTCNLTTGLCDTIGALPSPWLQQDIGPVGVAGGGSFDGATGTFTAQGSGADIDAQNDGFHYIYRALTGDGELIARVTSVATTDPWAKAGVMIRETLATNSAHAMMVLTPGNGVAFQRRTATNGWNQGASGGAATAPLWVRIQRAGNVFRGYRSPDGITWTQVGTDTISMNTTVFVGLALTSHNNAVLGMATFTNVTLVGGGAVTTTTTTSTTTTTTSSTTTTTAAGPTTTTTTLAGATTTTSTTTTTVPTPTTTTTTTLPAGGLPSPWLQQDIGPVGVAGSGTFDGATSTFTARGSGADIDAQNDGFHYIYQALTGDGELIARVTSVATTDPWAKAGVMIRETLATNSAHAMMVLTPGNGAAFQRRTATNGWNQGTSGGAATAPLWVRIQRAGNVFRGYRSPDGVTWTQVGTDTFTMNTTVLVGLALTSHNNALLGTATFTNVTLVGGGAVTTTTTSTTTTTTSSTTTTTASGPTTTTTTLAGATTTTSTTTTTVPTPTTTTTTTLPANGLPSPWLQQDIGPVGVAGSGTFDGATGTFTARGSGSDIDAQNDGFHYIYQALTGDGELIARVASLTNTDPWAKAGVMIRETLATNSKHAMMVLTPGNGASYQRRTATNGWNGSISGGAATAPLWVRIQRAGNVFRGYRSPDGVTWTQVGTDTFIMNATVFVGLALTSHNNAVLGTATFTNVTLSAVATTTTTTSSTTTTTGPPGIVTITTAGLPPAAVSKAYTATLVASGGTPPYSWTIASGLPPGLTLNVSTGVISGTPTAAGTFTFTAQVSAGAQNATRPLSIAVAAVAAANAIAAENAVAGNPASQWDVTGAGDVSLQGFGTDISVNKGGTISFKVSTNATDYRLDIYRLGYYGGAGARLMASVQPSAALPQSQPACLSDAATGLVDCGNWAVSASWSVPATATSGIYIAKLVREDPEDGRASHIAFIVRDDDGGSDMLFQTSDTTWQAYNTYGGNSLYNGLPVGRAYKVSYNRPYTTRCCAFPDGSNRTWLFNAEYPMVRFLERNGYDVSYSTGLDADRRGGEILEHRTYMTVGQNEYVSGGQEAAIEAGRNAGVNMAFFTGNQGFWKTRWEQSIDGSGAPYRTLVCYKETHANAKIDPLPGVWTGTWRDTRFGPHDGGRPENALNGNIFMVNGIRNDTPQVPAADGKMRFWRNTSIATLGVGQVATLPTGTLGFEWDEDLDNGSRPPGLVWLSSTTVPGVESLQDFGSTYATSTDTHHAVFYRHSSGALVFHSGTVQWSWGLDAVHDNASAAADPRMQQATVNLFADMSVQPATLQAGLVAATKSTDIAAPTAAITVPSAGFSLPTGTPVTVSGTASDVGGQVGSIEVSTDGGATWHPATGRAAWTYSWTPAATGAATVRARAVDDSGNIGTPAQVSGTVTGVAQCGNGQVDAGEACDGGACCTSGCQFAANTTVCRAAVGVCDVAETCSGSSSACPANGFAANGTACSDGVACTTDACNNGTCTGTPACPAGQTCNLTTGACDTPGAATNIWSTSTVPTGGVSGADLPVELGVKFRSDSAGSVTGVRFYKSALNTGTHVGNLWSSTGTLLASATFTGETASGWQQVTFPTPVAITANTVYVVSYFAPVGFYNIATGFFTTQGVDNLPLHAPASGVSGGNGVFTYAATSSFPTSTFADSNYWVDVLFSATP